MLSFNNSRVCLIFNPSSGTSQNWLKFSPLENIIIFFTEKKIPITIKPTMEEGDGIKLAKECISEGFTHILICGGDGTINEVVNGIDGSNVVLGIIPYGTANVLARSMGIPLDVMAACQHFLDSKEKYMDLGCANGRNYLIMSGIGFDAQIIEETDQDLKNTFGSWGFILKGAQKLLMPDKDLNIDTTINFIDQGKILRFRAWLILVANLAHYSGALKVALKAKPDDGLLDIVVFPHIRKDNNADIMQQLLAALSETHMQTGVSTFQSSEFEISTDSPVPCQIDGELIGNTPVHFTVKHNKLKYRW